MASEIKDLSSSWGVAKAQKDALHGNASALGEISAVGLGDTNHGINCKCNTYFTDISSILCSYSTSAQSDAERVVTIDEELASLDCSMGMMI